MDPITTAILAALAAGAAAGATDVGKKAIADAYEGLKAIIKKKFGKESEVAKAVENLEGKPDSPARQALLKEEVAAVKAGQDAEILAAVKALEEKLKTHGGERIQKMLRSEGGEQTMRGRGGAQKQEMADSPHGKQRME